MRAHSGYLPVCLCLTCHSPSSPALGLPPLHTAEGVQRGLPGPYRPSPPPSSPLWPHHAHCLSCVHLPTPSSLVPSAPWAWLLLCCLTGPSPPAPGSSWHQRSVPDIPGPPLPGTGTQQVSYTRTQLLPCLQSWSQTPGQEQAIPFISQVLASPVPAGSGPRPLPSHQPSAWPPRELSSGCLSGYSGGCCGRRRWAVSPASHTWKPTPPTRLVGPRCNRLLPRLTWHMGAQEVARSGHSASVLSSLQGRQQPRVPPATAFQ